MPKFIRLVARGEPLPIDGDGNQLRDFTYLGNVVDANLRAAAAPAAVGRVVNVATGRSATVNELADAIGRALDFPVEKTYREARAGDVHASWADISAARDLLGYEPLVTLEDGLRLTSDALLESAAARAV